MQKPLGEQQNCHVNTGQAGLLLEQVDERRLEVDDKRLQVYEQQQEADDRQ